MAPNSQYAERTRVGRWLAHILRALGLVCLIAQIPALVRAQNAPPTTVGEVEGLDITVDGGTAAGNGTLSGAPSIYVVNGGVVTVHSGEAQLTLAQGGKVGICGPAKFTVLQSAGAITLALNFGRLRIQIPAATQLRIFTPTIIATPLEINGRASDITVGLDLNDTLCVRAGSGAIQLEHQFTGEKLVVPQAGEFFLSAGKLLPVAGAAGSCTCAGLEAQVAQPVQPVPENGLSAPPITAPSVASKSGSGTKETPASEPPVELSVPAHNDESKPKNSAGKEEEAAPPAVTMPEYKVIMPPLYFSATSPSPPPDASPDTILLVRVAHIFPAWEFEGHVDAPPLAGAEAGLTQGSIPSAKSSKKLKSGFWAAVKRFFGARA
jgi:hypothetical protein